MWVQKVKSTGKYSCTERYTDELTGKVKTVSCTIDKDTAKNRKEAQKILNQKIQKKLTPTKTTITFKNIYNSYIEYQERTKKKSTSTRNKSALGQVVDIIGGDVLAEKLTANLVMASFEKSGKSAKTLNEYLKRFRTMIRWAYKRDLIKSKEFLDKLENFEEKDKKKDVTEKYLEREELKELVDKLEHPIWKEVVIFMALTGMRIGEVIALEKSDIDLENRVIHITKNYDYKNHVITSTKTIASNDTISIQDELVPVIQRINAMMSRQMLRLGYRSDLFFSNADGGHVHYYSINKYFRENTEKIIQKKLTLHSLRHTHASLLFEQGFSVQEVARRLRHGHNAKVTEEIYIHVTKKLKEKDAEKMKKVSLL